MMMMLATMVVTATTTTTESVEIFIVRIPFADLVQQTNLLFCAVAVSNVNLVYLKKYNLAHKTGLKLACLA